MEDIGPWTCEIEAYVWGPLRGYTAKGTQELIFTTTTAATTPTSTSATAVTDFADEQNQDKLGKGKSPPTTVTDTSPSDTTAVKPSEGDTKSSHESPGEKNLKCGFFCFIKKLSNVF